MKQYLLRRAGLAVLTLFLVSMIVFSLMRLMTGDVVTRMVEGQAYAPTLDTLRKELGLDRPLAAQYLEWVAGIVLRGDLGRSYWTRQPIWDEFVRRFPVTLELAEGASSARVWTCDLSYNYVRINAEYHT